MHRVNHALIPELSSWAPQPTIQYCLPTSKVAAFEVKLDQDSLDYYYSAACTFIEAINGLLNGSFAWSTVQLYYSAFYSTRSILGTNGIAIFYDNSKPFSLNLSHNSNPKKEKGNTHEVAFKILNRDLTIPEFNQPIDGKSPFEWLKERREEANYKLSKLYDPNMPSHFNYTSELSLFRSIDTYIADIGTNTFTFTHDKDHAIIAYPLLCLKLNKDRLQLKGLTLADLDISYLSSTIPDNLNNLKTLLLTP